MFPFFLLKFLSQQPKLSVDVRKRYNSPRKEPEKISHCSSYRQDWL
jgi:hypothetical protein